MKDKVFQGEMSLYFFWKLHVFRNCFNRCLLFESVWIIIGSNFLCKFLLFVLSMLQSLYYAYFSFLGCSEWWDRLYWMTEGSVFRYLGWKCSLFLHIFSELSSVLNCYCFPGSHHHQCSPFHHIQEACSTSHEKKTFSFWRLKSIFTCFLLSIQEALVPWEEKLFKQELWD